MHKSINQPTKHYAFKCANIYLVSNARTSALHKSLIQARKLELYRKTMGIEHDSIKLYEFTGFMPQLLTPGNENKYIKIIPLSI